MWLAIIVFVCLSAEVLSYLTGGESANELNDQKTSPETIS